VLSKLPAQLYTIWDRCGILSKDNGLPQGVKGTYQSQLTFRLCLNFKQIIIFATLPQASGNKALSYTLPPFLQKKSGNVKMPKQTKKYTHKHTHMYVVWNKQQHDCKLSGEHRRQTLAKGLKWKRLLHKGQG